MPPPTRSPGNNSPNPMSLTNLLNDDRGSRMSPIEVDDSDDSGQRRRNGNENSRRS